MSSSHPTSSNNYTDGYELMNLDVHHQSRKRQASEAASRHDDFQRSSHYDVQNMDPRRFGLEPADLHHQPLHEYYQQQRPDQGHTPPLDDHRKDKESPDEIALTINRFSGFLEDDAIGLAVDLRTLHRKYFEEQPVAQQMVFNLLVKGYTPLQCHAMLKKTSVVLQHIIDVVDSLGTRQPAVANRNEVLKTNDCDLPYHIFNLYTHGFGHANSIDHYKEQLAINKKAELLASALIHNIQMPPIELWKDGEKPFSLLSDHEAQNMIAVQCFRALRKLPKDLRTMELRRLTSTDHGQKIISMLSTINNDLFS
ncbi:unnamed protein product [Caenorhabditis brenneri]